MKTYNHVFSDTGPATNFVEPSIVISAGKRRCVPVPFMSEGLIGRVSVIQTGGAPVDFTVELLMSAKPYPVGEQLVADPVGSPVTLYRIIAQHIGAAGNAMEAFSEFGQPYHNIDSDFTNVTREIYLVIIPDGAAGSTTWDASITGWQQMG